MCNANRNQESAMVGSSADKKKKKVDRGGRMGTNIGNKSKQQG